MIWRPFEGFVLLDPVKGLFFVLFGENFQAECGVGLGIPNFLEQFFLRNLDHCRLFKSSKIKFSV